jgi:TonB family protein
MYKRTLKWQPPAVASCVVALIAAFVVSQPAAVAQDAGPLLKTDLVRMLVASNYTTDEVVRIVRMSCVSFRPSDRDRADLGDLPGGPQVLAAIDRCRRSGQAAGYREGIPQANAVAVQSRRRAAPTPVSIDEVDIPVDELVEAPDLNAPSFSVVVPEEKLVLAAAQTPPRLLNWDQVSRRLLAEYRPAERRGGTVVLRVHVDEDGKVSGPEVRTSSGDPQLDAAVLASADDMRFAPAMSRDRKVASWTELPIRFQTP